ncbi:unnamed protein product [Lactuca virosa]|uniref:Uncharacterized protein n=1 Tax=Lactuca virosa TaxID=75947 RepID=A0AAU9PL42_9ASTR|nr:unnamed protein product [Lactuca virosa]
MRYPSNISPLYRVDVIEPITQQLFELSSGDLLKMVLNMSLEGESLKNTLDLYTLDSEVEDIVKALEITNSTKKDVSQTRFQPIRTLLTHPYTPLTPRTPFPLVPPATNSRRTPHRRCRFRSASAAAPLPSPTTGCPFAYSDTPSAPRFRRSSRRRRKKSQINKHRLNAACFAGALYPRSTPPPNSTKPPPSIAGKPLDANIITLAGKLLRPDSDTTFHTIQNSLGHYSQTLHHTHRSTTYLPKSTRRKTLLRRPPPPVAATHFKKKKTNQKKFVSHRRFKRLICGPKIQAWGAVFADFFRVSTHELDPVYILPNPSIYAFTTNVPETWFLPQELPGDDAAAADDDMQVDPDNVDSPFEAEDHYDLPIRQLPPPYPCQASGSHSQPTGEHFQPQRDYHSYQKHNEPDPAHEFPLDIYSQLASLRLQGNRNIAAIHRIEEQQARTNTYMEDLWYYFQPEGGYPPRGPPPP